MRRGLNNSICSSNCRGWRFGGSYVANLLKSCDLCLIQEHWLLSEHLGALNSVSNDFLSIGVSGMDSGELLTGRPYHMAVVVLQIAFTIYL